MYRSNKIEEKIQTKQSNSRCTPRFYYNDIDKILEICQKKLVLGSHVIWFFSFQNSKLINLVFKMKTTMKNANL